MVGLVERVGETDAPGHRRELVEGWRELSSERLELVRRTVAEVSGWASALKSGASRDAVASAFLTSAEAYQLMVSCDYTYYLHRAADAGGNQVWTGQLQHGGMAPGTVCKVFLTSDEFFALARNASKV